MNMDEFNRRAVRSEDNDSIIFDVRPFGVQQGEAVDCYLHDRVMGLQMGTAAIGSRTVVVNCDAAAQMPQSVDGWLAILNSQGVPTEIRRV